MSKPTPDTPSAAPTVNLYAVETILQLQHNAAQKGKLTLWTIYDRPTDYPHGICARRHEVPGGPTENLFTGELELMRWLFREAGLHCMPRQENDDVKIIETWI